MGGLPTGMEAEFGRIQGTSKKRWQGSGGRFLEMGRGGVMRLQMIRICFVRVPISQSKPLLCIAITHYLTESLLDLPYSQILYQIPDLFFVCLVFVVVFRQGLSM